MKYLVILADGAADYPVESLGGKTPLQAAEKPAIDALCSRSRLGQLVTVPPDMAPGSEVANLSVLGYNVREVYQGRGVLEAASMGIELHEDDLALRCNLISLDMDGRILNHSAGHISTEESRELIAGLNEHLAGTSGTFYPGVSYRHLFVLPGGDSSIICTPPHDVPGSDYRDVLIRPESSAGEQTASLLNQLIESSQEYLQSHPVNLKRVSEGKDPANSIWFWSQGYKPKMETFQKRYGKNGSVISAVDLIFGIGVYAGLEPVRVEGATGLHDTNYEGKAEAALKALKEKDFVFLHIEASDEAGHEGNAELKVRTIESLDRRLVSLIMEGISEAEEPVAVALLPDHPTPCSKRTHVHDPVPVMICVPGVPGDGIAAYDEESVKDGSVGLLQGAEFMDLFLGVHSEEQEAGQQSENTT